MPQSYAVVPAAGRSVRMGQPKLLMPISGRPLLDRVLAAWAGSKVSRTIVVVRADDERLLARCRAFDVDVVPLRRSTADMKTSVLSGLRHIEREYCPLPDDAWVMAPADLPGLNTAVIDHVLNAAASCPRSAIVPVAGGRRGHPLLVPWAYTALAYELGRQEGLNALLERVPLCETPWRDAASFNDLDTPADFARHVADAGSISQPVNSPLVA